MPRYISFDGVCLSVHFDPTLMESEDGQWECVDSPSPTRIRVMFKRHVRGADSAPRFFVRATRDEDPDPPVCVFATADESAMGRCLTVQACYPYGGRSELQVYVTLADSRLDTNRLGVVMEICNELSSSTSNSERQHRILWS